MMSTETPVLSGSTKKQPKHSKSNSEKVIAASLVGAVPRPVYFISPVYIPYVQAPVCYGKSPQSSNKKIDAAKSEKKNKDKETVKKTKTLQEPPFRYVPSNCVTPANCVTLPTYNYLPSYSPYYRSNYAFQNGQVIPVGVVRAYPQSFVPLTSGWIPCNGVPVQQCTTSSKLNPLSEPYRPQKKSDTSESNEDENSNGRSNCSSPEAWRRSTEELSSVSRAGTPASVIVSAPSCVKCGGQLSGLQETDSGVGDEGDEIVCCCQDDAADSPGSEVAIENVGDEEQDQELHIPTLQSLEDDEEFSEEVVKLIEFICEQLQPHEWRAVARELGVSDVVIQCIEYDVYESVCEQMRYVFSYWARSRSLSKLTQDALKLVKNSFAEIGREDLVSALDVTSFSS